MVFIEMFYGLLWDLFILPVFRCGFCGLIFTRMMVIKVLCISAKRARNLLDTCLLHTTICKQCFRVLEKATMKPY